MSGAISDYPICHRNDRYHQPPDTSRLSRRTSVKLDLLCHTASKEIILNDILPYNAWEGFQE